MTTTSNNPPAEGEAQAPRRSRLRRLMRYIPLIAPVLLWAVPCGVLLYTGQHWPLSVTVVATVLFAFGLIGMPLAMARGHGRRQQTGRRSSVTPCWAPAGFCSPGPFCSASSCGSP